MLSRVAENLFWIARSIERADNVARLIDMSRRMVTLPNESGRPLTNEWSSILIAAGASGTFEGDLDTASREDAIEHLVADPATDTEQRRKTRTASRSRQVVASDSAQK